MSDNELQAKLSIQLGQALAGLKSLGGELRTVKSNIAELTANTNKLQQETSKTTKTQVDGAQAAGKATKTFNDYVADQVTKLVEAHRRTKALEEARRRLNLDKKPILAPTVDEFRALDQAKASALGFGRAHSDAAEKGKNGLALLHQGWVKIAAGAAIAARTIGEVSAKYEEMKDRAQQSYRQTGGAAMTMEQAFQASSATDAAGLTEEALRLKGPFTQEDLTGFVNQVVRRAPDTDDARWKTLLQAFQSTATVPGASQTLANLAGLAPNANAGQLDRMTREYTRSSGGRAMGEGEARNVQGLVNTGFFSAPEALAMVSSLAAYDRAGEAEGLASKLMPPKATGDPIADSKAADEWWKSVGYLKGQHGGGSRAVAAIAPELAAELSGGPLGKRVSTASYRLTSEVDAGAFEPRGLRTQAEAEERARQRDLQVDATPNEQGILEGREEARRRAAVELRKNAGARGEMDRAATDLAADAAGKIGLGRAYNAYDRAVNGEAPAPSQPQRPIQVEIVRDTTIRPLTY